MRTDWKPILATVDGSPEAATAARAAWQLAQAAGVECHLLHALPAAWEPPVEPPPDARLDPAALTRLAVEYAREAVQAELEGFVPEEGIRRLEVRSGRPAAVIAEAVREHDAGLVVVGGKHHSALGRWLVGSTAHALVRTLDVPVLVARELAVPLRSVVAAVDLSEAASPTVHAAERFAGLFQASLGLVHVLAPAPAMLDLPRSLFDVEVAERTREQLARHVWPLTTYRDVRTNVRHGSIEAEIAAESDARRADLVVVGSHGKGWFDRVVIGSTTERLLNALPASLLIVPVVTGRERRAPRAAAPRLALLP
jgi:nucleotide-binding universal stress UspA family protein